jgi:hypothetical protein
MSHALRTALVSLGVVLALALDAEHTAAEGDAFQAPEGTYLQPNVEDRDGDPGFIHVTPWDMPLRVEVPMPREAARFASRKQTRERAIEAMRQWEAALADEVPWFRIEFALEDPTAPFHVTWSRRLSGNRQGVARYEYVEFEGRIWAGGGIDVTTRIDDYTLLHINDVAKLFAHEFGHLLGLVHCLECDSAMNYAWEQRREIVVTETDVRTFVALLEIPNGMRVDGRRMAGAPPDDPSKYAEIAARSSEARPALLRAAAEEADRERVQEFEKQKATRLYVEQKGGWQVVEGYRLRSGPKPDEQWVSYEEMQRIKAGRASAGK